MLTNTLVNLGAQQSPAYDPLTDPAMPQTLDNAKMAIYNLQRNQDGMIQKERAWVYAGGAAAAGVALGILVAKLFLK